MRTVVIALMGVLTLGADASRLYAQESTPERDLEIRPLRGDVYEVRDGHEHTVFLVTREGIVLVDPLSRPAAAALKEQLDARFPGVPVRYIVLTHHHADRAAGAGVFGQVQLVAHRSYPEQLARSRQSNEAEYRFVRDVRDTFDAARTIRLGDASVQLAHVRSTHAPEMTVVFFAAERVLFAVAPPPVTAVPFIFDNARAREVFAWIDVVADLRPDMLLFDDGVRMDGSALEQLAHYLRSIRSEVASAHESGRALAQIQATSLPDLPESHADVPHGAIRSAHVAAVYRSLRLIQVELSGRAIATYTARNPPTRCDGTLTACSAGGAVAGGMGGLAVTVGRRIGVVAEGTFGEQFWSARARPGFQEETALRLSRHAVLVRYGAPRRGRFSYLPVAGLSWTTGHVRGLSHITGVLTPIGGYHQIETRSSRAGFTAGVDLVQTTSRGFSISAPLRFTRMMGERPQHWHTMTDVQAGIGVSVPIVRRIGMR